MPFEGDHANDIGLETADGPVCIHDVQDGAMKTPEDIFEGGVQFFLSVDPSGDRALAERLVRKNMNGLAYWQSHPFAGLQGPVATDEEFGVVMAKL